MLAFLHIEKCGGTTLIHLLRQTFSFDHCDVIPADAGSMTFTRDDLKRLIALRPSTASLSGHSIRVQSGLHEETPIDYYTLLRDPVKRYLSDYHHLGKNFLLDDPSSFEDWLELESRHNYQTRSIAGSDNLAEAIRLVDEQFAFVGLVEEYQHFLRVLKHLIWTKHHKPCPPEARPKNVRSDDAHVRDEQSRILERHRDQILEANRHDLELYRHVAARNRALSLAGVDSPEAKEGPLSRRFTLAAAWLYRNAIYKPHMGHRPFSKHTLPIYDINKNGRRSNAA